MIIIIFAAMKIHVSEYTKKILEVFGTFILDLRGEVEMKVRFLPSPQS